MGIIKASMADVSTDFKLVDPGLYTFEITKVEDQENNGKHASLDREDTIACRIQSEVQDEGEMHGRKTSDLVTFYKKNGEVNEIGLSQLKRYFEAAFGKDEVATWSDEDYDTDRLVGMQFRGQIIIDSYTPEGATEPKQNNKFKRIESVS